MEFFGAQLHYSEPVFKYPVNFCVNFFLVFTSGPYLQHIATHGGHQCFRDAFINPRKVRADIAGSVVETGEDLPNVQSTEYKLMSEYANEPCDMPDIPPDAKLSTSQSVVIGSPSGASTSQAGIDTPLSVNQSKTERANVFKTPSARKM